LRTEHHEDLADVLDRMRVECGADPRQERFAQAAVVRRCLDLDQFVALEVDVDLAQHGGRESLVTDGHDRVECVCARLEGLALRRGERSGSCFEWAGHALF